MPIVYRPKLRDANFKHSSILSSPMAVVFFLLLLFIDLPLSAQLLYKVKIPGTAFSASSPGKKVTTDDLGSGRRFRGEAFAKVILSARLRIPPATAADPKMQQLVIRFSTSASGPSLRTVELRNGGSSSFHIDTHLTGNYTTKEVTKPASLANIWVLDPPERIGSTTVLRIEIIFPGGFDSQINPGEFILNSVELGFPRKITSSSTTVTNNMPPSSIGTADRSGGNPPIPSALSAARDGVIYVLSNDNNLVWYKHTGRGNGSFNWATSEGKKVGTGWGFKQIFAADNNVIYAITNNDDLLWFRHDGHNDGSFRWATAEGKKVGNGWHFRQVFSGENGVIYAINENGDLLWFRHEGRNDGSFRWAAAEGKKVGNGWNFNQVFSGGDGVIYAITSSGDLLWFRHEGRNDGSFRWAAAEGKKVGNGWNFKHVFSGGDGVIYAITSSDDLLWFRHEGRNDGSFRWATAEGKKVGNGWSVQQIFSR